MVGDPMEKTTLEGLDWKLSKGVFTYFNPKTSSKQLRPGDNISPNSTDAPHRAQITIRRRFQFSSALKRMSTVSTLSNGKMFAAVKGAPETIKTMLSDVPASYDDTYKWYTRRGSRVLALASKYMEPMPVDKVCALVFTVLVIS